MESFGLYEFEKLNNNKVIANYTFIFNFTPHIMIFRIDNINIFINKEKEIQIIEKIKLDFIKNNGLVILVPNFKI